MPLQLQCNVRLVCGERKLAREELLGCLARCLRMLPAHLRPGGRREEGGGRREGKREKRDRMLVLFRMQHSTHTHTHKHTHTVCVRPGPPHLDEFSL
jgi:hypothetical protein